ncbi:TIGR03086 family metal-binding protein [Glycomyces mayteni]|uniref:TIGR03086 family metal-binding protein n=1 Tax=Glycomyces mayteni TaxID=543887 RepID=A0ABW2DG05_9ACTN|nr:TIGR03086 family metal-binding protein [Glycomyces mayteni]
MTGLLEFHAVALNATVDLVDGAERLDVPTPCAGWDLGRLVAHMTGQNLGFAAAARGDEFSVRTWAEVPSTPAAFRASAAEVLAAFASDGAAGREWSILAGADQEVKVAGETAMGFHFIDYVAHAWDVGAALGRPPVFAQPLLDAVLPLVLAVPATGPSRTGPYAPFAPAVTAAADASTMDEILAYLGRDPKWKAPSPEGEGARVKTD